MKMPYVKVIFAKPRMMCVVMHAPGFHVEVVSAHGHHTGKRKALRQEFWDELRDELLPFPRAIVGVDANATTFAHLPPYIGQHGHEKANDNTFLLEKFLQATKRALPSTMITAEDY